MPIAGTQNYYENNNADIFFRGPIGFVKPTVMRANFFIAILLFLFMICDYAISFNNLFTEYVGDDK